MASQSTYVDGPKTFTAYEAMPKFSRVKFKSGTTENPPEVHYADQGEQAIGVTEHHVAAGDCVAVRMLNKEGTLLGIASEALSRGATLYAADDGEISDTSSGTSIGIALEEATADQDIIEYACFTIISTAAANISLADAGTFTDQTTVEAAIAEIYQDLFSAQGFIPVPLSSLFESDATNITALAGNTTPVRDMANGDTDSGIVLTWATPNVDAVIFQVPLPPDLDVSADVVVHFRAKSGGATDTPVFAADSYFNEGDTKVEDNAAALGAAYAEKTVTIAAADVPAGAQTLTCELTPGAHTTDTIVLSAIWIEYTRALKTS